MKRQKPMKQYVAYYRVWPKQTPSSAEIRVQKNEVARFVSYNGGRIIAAHTERENNRGDRPEFAKAVEERSGLRPRW